MREVGWLRYQPVDGTVATMNAAADPVLRRRLASAAQRIVTTRAKQAAAVENARTVALEAIEAGMSERAVTDALGVDRNTVRAWQGKPR